MMQAQNGWQGQNHQGEDVQMGGADRLKPSDMPDEGLVFSPLYCWLQALEFWLVKRNTCKNKAQGGIYQDSKISVIVADCLATYPPSLFHVYFPPPVSLSLPTACRSQCHTHTSLQVGCRSIVLIMYPILSSNNARLRYTIDSSPPCQHPIDDN
jgi:hypothetical protein